VRPKANRLKEETSKVYLFRFFMASSMGKGEEGGEDQREILLLKLLLGPSHLLKFRVLSIPKCHTLRHLLSKPQLL
jgi:hypothetical protein